MNSIRDKARKLIKIRLDVANLNVAVNFNIKVTSTYYLFLHQYQLFLRFARHIVASIIIVHLDVAENVDT